MTPTPDHEALLRLLTIAEQDLPQAIKAARAIHARNGVGSQVERVEYAKFEAQCVADEMSAVVRLLRKTLERIDP